MLFYLGTLRYSREIVIINLIRLIFEFWASVQLEYIGEGKVILRLLFSYLKLILGVAQLQLITMHT